MIRGADGGVISSGYSVLSNVGEAFHAELFACLHAVRRAPDLGIQKVILATDASMVVQAVTFLEIDRSSAHGLIWELKNLLSTNFAAFDVIHNHRSCNLVDHNLVSLGASLSQGTDPVVDSIPFCIRSFVAKDWALVYDQ